MNFSIERFVLAIFGPIVTLLFLVRHRWLALGITSLFCVVLGVRSCLLFSATRKPKTGSDPTVRTTNSIPPGKSGTRISTSRARRLNTTRVMLLKHHTRQRFSNAAGKRPHSVNKSHGPPSRTRCFAALNPESRVRPHADIRPRWHR